jgi:hypothetical protein
VNELIWRGEDGQVRVLIASRQRLFSVDAKSSEPDLAFGQGGVVGLNVGLGRDTPRLHTQEPHRASSTRTS